jgi:hypothetical protein
LPAARIEHRIGGQQCCRIVMGRLVEYATRAANLDDLS